MIDSEILSLRERGFPVVAIIGRPNVGKSTLFNRLIGKRRAITDAVPGVTRDILVEKWQLENHTVLLVDSGGVTMERQGMDDHIARRSLAVLAAADAVILMMDCTQLTAEDEALIQTARPFSEKVVIAVNKVDNPLREGLAGEYYRFGYPRVLSLSAEHGLGIEELKQTLLTMLDFSASPVAPQEDERVKIAVLGKPNTGKSTLTNLLTGKETALVDELPGTTRDVVYGDFDYQGTLFTILDTAGIRRKKKVEENIEYYSVHRAIKSIHEADVVLLLVDVTQGLSEQDKKIAQLVVNKGKGIVLVFTKTDLLRGTGISIAEIQERTRFLFPVLSFAPLVFISAKEHHSIAKVLKAVLLVKDQLYCRVETAPLNKVLRQWIEAYPIPRRSSGYFKVYYGTQVSICPVRFLFFVNRTKDFPQEYVQYLKNCIRRDLGFTSIPIDIELRERRSGALENSLS